MNTTRRGKIARLPSFVRDMLNDRLRDGEQARAILKWLHSLPTVCSILDAEFDGKPINEQNLSDWRKGGYREWLLQQASLKAVSRLRRDTTDLLLFSGDLTENTALWLTAQYLIAAQAKLDKDGNLDWKTLREFSSDLVALRRGDHSKARLVLERKQLEFEERLTTDRWKRSVVNGLKSLQVLADTHPKIKKAYLELAKLVREPFDDFLDTNDPPPEPEPALDPVELMEELFGIRPPETASSKPSPIIKS